MKETACIGWWKQLGYHADMEGLRMRIDGDHIQGSGIDVVGSFVFDGILADDGSLVMKKQYLGAHAVHYRGQFNGKDHFWGSWELTGMQGPWEILAREGEEEAVEREERQAESNLNLLAIATCPSLG